jgi:hypothetical protein
MKGPSCSVCGDVSGGIGDIRVACPALLAGAGAVLVTWGMGWGLGLRPSGVVGESGARETQVRVLGQGRAGIAVDLSRCTMPVMPRRMLGIQGVVGCLSACGHRRSAWLDSLSAVKGL